MKILKSIRFWRRLAQISVALAFVGVPVLNWYGWHAFYGNFLSFNFGAFTVVDPMAALQVFLGSLTPLPKTLLGAGLILLPALVGGPLFCSWVCPFGLFSELTHAARSHFLSGARSRGPFVAGSEFRLLTKRARSAAAIPGGATHAVCGISKPYKVKLIISALGLLGVALFIPFPALNQLSMPGWYSRLMQHLVMYGQILWPGLALMLVVLGLEKLARRRLWCRYVCPQSLLLCLCGLLWPRRLKVRFERKKCVCAAEGRLCLQACSLNLDPRGGSAAHRLECTNCGDCVEACKAASGRGPSRPGFAEDRGQALSLGFGKKA